MSGVIAIWATAVATVDVLARIGLMLAAASRAAGQVAAEREDTAAEAAGRPADPAARTSAGQAAR